MPDIMVPRKCDAVAWWVVICSYVRTHSHTSACGREHLHLAVIAGSFLRSSLRKGNDHLAGCKSTWLCLYRCVFIICLPPFLSNFHSEEWGGFRVRINHQDYFSEWLVLWYVMAQPVESMPRSICMSPASPWFKHKGRLPHMPTTS